MSTDYDANWMGRPSHGAPWWPPIAAAAFVPTLILGGIVAAAVGASDAVVVGVIVGPLLLAGLGALLVALGALVYMPFALWRDSRRRTSPPRTPQPRPSIRPEPRPNQS